MKNKWLILAVGAFSFVALSAGSCDEDNDVDCDEETGAWTKCEDGKLKQCYKSELSGDYIYKSEKCESGECASETACFVEETDGGITPAPTDGGVIDVGDGGTVVSDGGYVVIDDAGTDPGDGGTDPNEKECNEANAGTKICKEFTPGGKAAIADPEVFVLTCMQLQDSTWAFSQPTTCPSNTCNEDFTDCGDNGECNEQNEGKVICTTDGEHAYYSTCTLLVNPNNPSETSHAYEPGTKCEVYGSNKCQNDRYCASPEGGMSGEIPCGPENKGQVICVDVNGKGMIETCDEWSMGEGGSKEWFFGTSPDDCANGCNDAHTGCK